MAELGLVLSPVVIRGKVEDVSSRLVSGWAYNPDDPLYRFALAIYGNGRLLGRVIADRYRPDLEKAGFGDGKYGFLLKISGLIDSEIDYEIRVVREADGRDCKGSPQWISATEKISSFPKVKTKADITNLLIRKYNFKSYLELCCVTTGFLFGQIDRSLLVRRDRIVYKCNPEFDDGHEIAWRVEGENLDNVLMSTLMEGLKYDVVFVDSHHTIECSARDLAFASAIKSSAGLIVMHDASPPTWEMAAVEPVRGEWCGQSYAALIDFLILRPDLPVYVIDVDWGVAVLGSPNGKPLSLDSEALANWRGLADRPEERFAFFDAHRKQFLNLISVEEFLKLERLHMTDPALRPFQQIFPVGRAYEDATRLELLRDLARLHGHLGNTEQTVTLLELCLKENPEDKIIQTMLARLAIP